MGEKIKISAAVTSCRREAAIVRRAIQSIAGQSYAPAEILLIDDNPKDSPLCRELEEICRETENARYLSLGGNHGVSMARNAAIEAAQGDFIAFLDDDDEWLPEKLALQAGVLKAHPGADLIFGMGLLKHADGSTEPTWQDSIFKENPSFADMLSYDYVGSASQPMMRLSAVRRAGGFLKKDQPAVEDYELWIRLTRAGETWGTRERLYLKYMPEGEHVSMNHARTFQGYRNIYLLNREDYKKNRRARNNILYNVCREGLKAKKPAALPYLIGWVLAGAKHP